MNRPSLSRRFDRIRSWLRGHPFLVALVVLLLVAVPGYWRTATIANEAHDTADRVDEVVIGNEEDRLAVALDFCRSSNDARAAVRDAFVSLFAELERMGVRSDALVRLRAALPPQSETDYDCDGDGDLDEDDYAA